MKSAFYKINLIFLLLVIISAGCREEDPFDAGSGTFTDQRDGHVYKWVKIGEQIWMAENLAYVPYVCAPDSQCGIWIYGYDGEGSYGTNYHTYGALYDWETAMEVCPEGWHLPSDQEWMELERFLGMEEDQLNGIGIIRGVDANVGGKLKEIGNTYWKEPNEGATNETRFSALPGGILLDDNSFSSLTSVAYIWSSTSSENNTAFCRMLHYYGGNVTRKKVSKISGLSIRCVKN